MGLPACLGEHRNEELVDLDKFPPCPPKDVVPIVVFFSYRMIKDKKGTHRSQDIFSRSGRNVSFEEKV